MTFSCWCAVKQQLAHSSCIRWRYDSNPESTPESSSVEDNDNDKSSDAASSETDQDKKDAPPKKKEKKSSEKSSKKPKVCFGLILFHHFFFIRLSEGPRSTILPDLTWSDLLHEAPNQTLIIHDFIVIKSSHQSFAN